MMTLLGAIRDGLMPLAVQAVVGCAILAAQVVLYITLRQTRPNIRFHELKDDRNDRVTFLIRNLDSVRYSDGLVVALAPRVDLERVRVHAGPYCHGDPIADPEGDRVLIRFRKVPANATFSIQVKPRPDAAIALTLAESSELRPRNFNAKLAPFRGVQRFSYFLARALAGLVGFVTVLMFGLWLDHDALAIADWAYVGAAIPLALAVFVLVVPTGGKPIVAGYLGWSGASKDWTPVEAVRPRAVPEDTTPDPQ